MFKAQTEHSIKVHEEETVNMDMVSVGMATDN